MEWKEFALPMILDEKIFDKSKSYIFCHQDKDDPRCDNNGCYYHCVWWSKHLKQWTNGHGIYDGEDFLWFNLYREIDGP